MSRRAVPIVIWAVILLAFAFVWGYGMKRSPNPMMQHARLPGDQGLSSSEVHVVSGRAIQAARGELAVRTQGGRAISLRMTENTDVLLDGGLGLRDELRPGDEVRAVYQGSGNEPTVIRVEASSAHANEAAAHGTAGSWR